MPAYVIAEMSWTDVAAAARITDLCLLPVGAVEAYGPHLPQGSDGLVAERLAREAADVVSCLVAPLVPVGFSHSLQEFPGTLSVPTAALRAYLAGIAESLLALGVRRLVFVNGHAGNVAVIADLVEDLKRGHPGCRFAQVDLWRFLIPHAATLMESVLPQGHAAETNTSVLLALAPHLVRMERAVSNPPEADRFPEILHYRSYRDRAPDAVLGDATRGTAEKGREVMRRGVARLVEFLRSPDFGGR
ncbi:MAG: creatininase family protein [Armatimonadota bacterium]|nr:creatininase family protein [Armatimonadota bacterium]